MAEENQQDPDPQFEPIIRLTEQVAVTTGEENEDILFKMRAKLFRFDKPNSEWKERGTGDVRILQAKSKAEKIRLVMRRDKTLKVCANHIISKEMVLAPNIGSDRSWVWNVAADVSDGEPSAETLAIRFANADNAGLFKKAFEDAAEDNAKFVASSATADEPKKEETAVLSEPEKVVAAEAEAAPTSGETPAKVEEKTAEEEKKTDEEVAPVAAEEPKTE